MCQCDTGYQGRSCDIKVDCKYWDVAKATWSTEGCEVSPPPRIEDAGFVHCLCTHLTDFGGIGIPTTMEDLLGEFAAVTFAMFTIDDIVNVLGDFDPLANQEVFFLLMSCTAIDVLMMGFAMFRRHRRKLKIARAADKKRNEARAVAREAQRLADAKEQEGKALERRRQRKMMAKGGAQQEGADVDPAEAGALEGAGDIGLAYTKKKTGAIQDRIFLNLLDPDAAPPPVSVGKKLATAPFDQDTEGAGSKQTGALKLPAEKLSALLGPPPPSVHREVRGSGQQVVPWAELLEQRIQTRQREKERASAAPSGMLQQRLPSRASLIGNQCNPQTPLDSSAYKQSRISMQRPTTPSRLQTLSNTQTPRVEGGHVSTRLALRRAPSKGSLVLTRSASNCEMPGALGLTPRLQAAAIPSGAQEASTSLRGQSSVPRQSEGSLSASMPVGRMTISRPGSAQRSRPGTARSRPTMSAEVSAPATAVASDVLSTYAPAEAFAEPKASARKSARQLTARSAWAEPEVAPGPASAVPEEVPSPTKEPEPALPEPINAPRPGSAEPDDVSMPVVDDIIVRSPSPAPASPEPVVSRPGTAPADVTAEPDDAPSPVPKPSPAWDDEAAPAAPEVPSAPPSPPTSARLPSVPTQLDPRELDVSDLLGMPADEAASIGDLLSSVESALGESSIGDLLSSVESALGESASPSAGLPAQRGLPTRSTAAPRLSSQAGSGPGAPATDPEPAPAQPKRTEAPAGESMGVLSSSNAPATSPAASPLDPPGLLSSRVRITRPLGDSEDGGQHAQSVLARLKSATSEPEDAAAGPAKQDSNLQGLIGRVRSSDTVQTSIAEKKAGLNQIVARAKQRAQAAAGDAVRNSVGDWVDEFKTTKDELKSVKGAKALGNLMRSKSILKLKKFVNDFVYTARHEHTIANAVAPPDEDLLGENLTDEQVIHIFWSTMFGELFVIFMLSQNETSGFRPITIIYTGAIASLSCAVLAKIMKEIFKFGNKKRRRHSYFDKFGQAYKQRRQQRKLQREKGAVDDLGAMLGEQQAPSATWDILPWGRLQVRAQKSVSKTTGAGGTMSASAQLQQMQREAELKDDAAQIVQNLVRQWKARKAVAARKEEAERVEQERVEQEKAAARIQARSKGARERRRTDREAAKERRELEREKQQAEAAVTLQSIQRRRKGLAQADTKRHLIKAQLEALKKAHMPRLMVADFNAVGDSELSAVEGELMIPLRPSTSGWCQVIVADKSGAMDTPREGLRTGYVPHSFLTEAPATELPKGAYVPMSVLADFTAKGGSQLSVREGELVIPIKPQSTGWRQVIVAMPARELDMNQDDEPIRIGYVPVSILTEMRAEGVNFDAMELVSPPPSPPASPPPPVMAEFEARAEAKRAEEKAKQAEEQVAVAKKKAAELKAAKEKAEAERTAAEAKVVIEVTVPKEATPGHEFFVQLPDGSQYPVRTEDDWQPGDQEIVEVLALSVKQKISFAKARGALLTSADDDSPVLILPTGGGDDGAGVMAPQAAIARPLADDLMMQVTVPPGVKPGQTFFIRLSDGREHPVKMRKAWQPGTQVQIKYPLTPAEAAQKKAAAKAKAAREKAERVAEVKLQAERIAASAKVAKAEQAAEVKAAADEEVAKAQAATDAEHEKALQLLDRRILVTVPQGMAPGRQFFIRLANGKSHPVKMQEGWEPDSQVSIEHPLTPAEAKAVAAARKTAADKVKAAEKAAAQQAKADATAKAKAEADAAAMSTLEKVAADELKMANFAAKMAAEQPSLAFAREAELAKARAEKAAEDLALAKEKAAAEKAAREAEAAAKAAAEAKVKVQIIVPHDAKAGREFFINLPDGSHYPVKAKEGWKPGDQVEAEVFALSVKQKLSFATARGAVMTSEANKPALLVLKAFGDDPMKSNRFLAAFGAKGGEGISTEAGSLWKVGKMADMSKSLKAAHLSAAFSKPKLTAEEKERKRRASLIPFSRNYVLFRSAICWLANFVIFANLWVWNYVFGATFGPVMFTSILYAWGLALFNTWIIVEPSEVLALILVPGIAKNKYVVRIKTKLKNWGFI